MTRPDAILSPLGDLRTSVSVPLSLTLAHPSNCTLTGDRRWITWLLSVYAALLITLSPGYVWSLCLTPDGPGARDIAGRMPGAA